MSRDGEREFRVRPGRIRAKGDGARASSFVGQVLRAASKKGDGLPSSEPAGSVGRSAPSKCARIGRGQVAASMLSGRAARDRAAGGLTRRVVVKARIVKLAGMSTRGAGAHLRYLQRDGVTREGERGQLYGAIEDSADGDAFVERGRGDRHQFRFIVAPEDGAELTDLPAFTRDLMAGMERDLGTKLDWVAVDHFNTGHPHTHVVIRGREAGGGDLVIAQDYITEGLRHRAAELATLELGPQSELELGAKLAREVGQERFTRLDRMLVERAGEIGVADMRHDPAAPDHYESNRTLLVGRLQTLGRLGLTEEVRPSSWRLSPKLEETLTALGERGDIVKAMNRALRRHGLERGAEAYVVHDGRLDRPVTGRLIGKGLAGEGLDDRLHLVIDGVDGRTHYVEVAATAADEAKIGMVVEVGPERVGPRAADSTIARMAAEEGGVYRPGRHLAQAIADPAHADPQTFVQAHVRRLEALRRAGVVERLDADHWRLPGDFAERALAHDQRQPARSPSVRALSALELEKQITSDGATWLDRQLVGRDRVEAATTGYGTDVRRAIERRRDHLVAQGHARRASDGRIAFRSGLLDVLERQEVARVGRALAAERGLIHRPVQDGESVRGKLMGSAQLASGRFAMLDDGFGFSLVPWRPALEAHVGKEVAGALRGGNISWSFGRGKGLGI